MTRELPKSIAEMQDIIDIESIVRSAYPGWIKLIIMILLAMFFCAALIWAIRKLWKRFGGPDSAVVMTIEQLALKDLAKLKKKQWPEQNKWPLYYFELDEILRRYIQLRFGFDLLDKTYEQIRSLLKSGAAAPEFLQLPSVTISELKVFWEGAQLIKFAKMPGTVADCEKDFMMVKIFVETTKQAKS
ncbi:MAG: hypothetical protein ACD_62C00335G0003 [uncultured bacterium]|nr:MAG: hypothetical protein ACD_62C00335G0003 [uncultured bacterium]HLD43810.1 hypothetical protein [bacterium]